MQTENGIPMEFNSIVRATRLFCGMGESETEKALSLLGAETERCAQGELLARQGESLRRFGIVLSGAVQVYMDDINGDRMIMASVTPGESFGEALCYLETPEIPVCICAAEDSLILWLTTGAIKRGETPLARELTGRFISMLAERTLNMNNRIQVLSKLTLREKLTALFTEYAAKAGSETFSLPFDRVSMACYLGCERSSLSRELSKMKREGVIDFYKNSFRLIKQR